MNEFPMYIIFIHLLTSFWFRLFSSYFVVDFDSSPSLIEKLGDFRHRDIDIVRQGIKRREDPPAPPCEGQYSDLYTGASNVNKMLRPKKKKGAVKWPNVDKLD